MARQLRQIKVFVSSPGDVREERDIVDRVIGDLNLPLAQPFGFQIEILPWDARIGPASGVGMGRAQARINPLVVKADLFVGILWKRFGQPTGAFESGTEEEFEKARERWKEHQDPKGWPEIWMYFRDVGEEFLNDPGPQLQKVLSFKERLEEERICLYKSYREPSDLEQDFRKRLTRLLVELSKGEKGLPSEPIVRGAVESISKGGVPAPSLLSFEEVRGEVKVLNAGLVSIDRSIAGKVFTSEKLDYVVEQCLNPQGTQGRAFLVVGQPGGGKSVFLAQLYERIEGSVSTLAVQCERHLDASDDWIDHVGQLIKQMQEYEHGPTVVIIDSLDVLAAGRIPRLQRWLMLIERLRLIPGTTVVCACRPFEAKYVYPLNEQGWTETVEIGFLSDEWINDLLREHLGVDFGELSPATKELLRVPLHLRLAVEIIRGGGNIADLTTTHMVYGRLLDIRKVDGDRLKELRRLAKTMTISRSTSIARPRLGDFKHVDFLTATGLVVGYDTVRFIHPTLLDFLIALDVVKEGKTVRDFLEEYGQGLFVRPVLRHILAFLRSDRRRLFTELQGVFLQGSAIRMHVKLAILSDMASWQDPSDAEAQFLLRLFREAPDGEQLEVQFFAHGPDPAWFPCLWEPFLRPAVQQVPGDGRRLRSLAYLSRASKVFPDEIIDIALELVRKPVDRELVIFFRWLSDAVLKEQIR